MARHRAGPGGEHDRRLPPRPRRLRRVARRATAHDLDDGRHRRRSSTSSPSGGPAARRASSVARQLAAVRTLHRHLVTEGERPDDPTADLEGVRVPAGLPKPLSEAEVTALLDAVVGHDPVDAARPGAARAAVRHRRPDLRGVRAVDGRHRLRRPPRAAVRQGRRRSASCRSGGPPAAALDEWFSPRGRVLLGARAVAAARRRRGGVPQPARRPADPPGGVGGRPAATASGPGMRDRAVAARAAPLVRHPPARPRRRPARRAGAARPRLDLDDAGVHEGQPGAPVGGLPGGPPPGAGDGDDTSPGAPPRAGGS